MFKGVSSGLDRLEAYKAKIRAYTGTGAQPDYTAPIVQQKLGAMYRKAQQAFSEQASYQNAVSYIVGMAGVSVIMRAGYQAFAGALYRLASTQTGESKAMEAAVILAHWVARGLNSAILMSIRDQVFGIPAPTPP